jgi:hypothetical protein
VRCSLVLCAILLAGCSAPAGAGSHAGEPYLVNSQRTLFYSFGPAQATGPDFALYHGQRLTMLNYAYGYSRVAIQGTGQSGYVPTEDVLPAPQPSPTASPSLAHTRRGSPSRPPTAADQSQIPLPAFPESQPPPGAPAFRY